MEKPRKMCKAVSWWNGSRSVGRCQIPDMASIGREVPSIVCSLSKLDDGQLEEINSFEKD